MRSNTGGQQQTVLSETNEEKSTTHFSCPFTKAEYSKRAPTGLEPAHATAVNLSHHLLASDLIAATLSRIEPNYDTIVIIGPNHHGLGNYQAITSYGKWETPFGEIEPNYDVLNSLTQNGVRTFEDVFTVEHSICSLTSFVKLYFPGAKIVPIVLNTNTSGETERSIADTLSKNCRNCLLIASVDFSHEVSEEKAKQNDLVSAEILTKLDIASANKIVSDSEPALVTEMYYLKSKGVPKGWLVYNSNSNEVSEQDLPTVTSYLFLMF